HSAIREAFQSQRGKLPFDSGEGVLVGLSHRISETAGLADNQGGWRSLPCPEFAALHGTRSTHQSAPIRRANSSIRCVNLLEFLRALQHCLAQMNLDTRLPFPSLSFGTNATPD